MSTNPNPNILGNYQRQACSRTTPVDFLVNAIHMYLSALKKLANQLTLNKSFIRKANVWCNKISDPGWVNLNSARLRATGREGYIESKSNFTDLTICWLMTQYFWWRLKLHEKSQEQEIGAAWLVNMPAQENGSMSASTLFRSTCQVPQSDGKWDYCCARTWPQDYLSHHPPIWQIG